MGQNLALNIARNGFRIVVYNRSFDKTEATMARAEKGWQMIAAKTPQDVVRELARPRRVLLLVKAGQPVDDTIALFLPLLEAGDMIIDAGNSHPDDTERRSLALQKQGFRFVGMGVSGGEEGALWGPSLMPGGEASAYDELAPILRKIAAQVADGPCVTHIGPGAAGHFVKMVHNGIEYGMMAAIAEGLSIIKHADAGKHQQEVDAETTPLRDPEYYQYEIDVAEVAEVWRRGSVVGSWLVDLTASALASDPSLDAFDGRVSDSGEGRWTTIAAIEEGVPAPVITASLIERFESRGLGQFSGKVQSAMRSEFGGHDEKKA